MILVDTSVWIDFFKNEARFETALLREALNHGVVIAGDLIVLEILQGFHSDKDYKTTKKHLESLDQYNMLSPELAIKAADNYRELRKKGITIRKTNDVIIATFCIENDIPLLFEDRDFIPFTQHLKLRSVS